jgi:segregation and condensation protein B
MSVESTFLQKILEGALLAAGEALNIERILSLFDETARPSKEDVQAALLALQEQCVERGFRLVEVASGWRFQVASDLAPWVNRLWEEKPQRYSRALLETLALIAYRQPLTRNDIEEVRGVAVSSHIIKTLAEREWIKVVGHRDVPGRPSLYATTRQFLDYFGLKSLDELPSLGELKDFDSFNETLALAADDEILLEQEQIAVAQELSNPGTASLFDTLETHEESPPPQAEESVTE